MKRIVRLTIENYQSHAHTVLEPAAGLTVITGPSDAGKSAVLRALRWVYQNEPQGTGFIRAGQSRARVAVELEDGTRVVRERSASGAVNRYVIERPGEEPVVLEGFGHGVPEPVREALGTRSVRLGNEELDLGYGEQLGPPFLLRMPGAARAEAIERLTGVHLLAQAAVTAARREQAAQRKAREARDRLGELEQALAAYADLPAWEQAVAAFEQVVAEFEAAQARLRRLEEIRSRLHRAEDGLREVERQLEALRNLDGLAEAVEQVSQGVERLSRLERRRAQIEENERARTLVRAVLEATRGLDEAAASAEQARAVRIRLEHLEGLRRRLHQNERRFAEQVAVEAQLAGVDRGQQLIDEALVARQRIERLGQYRQRIAAWKRAMRQVQQDLAEAERNAQAAAEAYRQALMDAGRCPTCGQAVDPAALAEHLKEAM